MKAVAGVLPPPGEDGWSFEIKWDGMRALAYIEPQPAGRRGLRLVTANGKDATNAFPELWPLGDAFGDQAVLLDGEVVAFGDPADQRPEAGARPDFARLQQRMHVDNPAEARRRADDVPVSYVVFDLLHLDDMSLLGLAYSERRRLLSDLVPDGTAWTVPPARQNDGDELLKLVQARGMEGLMAKRLDSTYQPGRRSPAWRKVKVRCEQEFVVGGWTAGSGNRSGVLGALLLGVVDDEATAAGGTLRLRYVGRVGTGFNAPELDRLAGRFADLADGSSPFVSLPAEPKLRLARFVRPEMVVQVAFGEWTTDGVLRHPSYLGERVDKEPADVHADP